MAIAPTGEYVTFLTVRMSPCHEACECINLVINFASTLPFM
jgi:hypothetical protein